MQLDYISLFSFVLVTTFTPGPNNISSASMGMLFGYKKTLKYLTGIATGFFIIMILCAYLASNILSVMPFAEPYLRCAGSIYILWLAIGTMRSTYVFGENNLVSNAFTKGFLLQLLNPKAIVYGLTIYSTFLSPVKNRIDFLTFFAAVFACTAFLATSTWAVFGSIIRERMKSDLFRKIINTLLSLLLVYTAIDLSGIFR